MTILIFTAESCPLCPAAKKLAEELKAVGADIQMYDKMDESATELAIASLFSVQSLPTVLIIDNDDTVAEWRGAVPDTEEVMMTVMTRMMRGKR